MTFEPSDRSYAASDSSFIGDSELYVDAGSWSTTLVRVDRGQDDYITREMVAFREYLRSLSGSPLAFLICDLNVRTISRFLQLIDVGIPVALIDSALNTQSLSTLLDRYEPEIVLTSADHHIQGGYSPIKLDDLRGVWSRVRSSTQHVPHSNLAVLLTTSGSTGSPKFVRLSRFNLESNAEQIAKSLSIGADDRAITALPIHYSFGMSVVTSHARAGASIVVTSSSLVSESFWISMRRERVSFFPGVPQSLVMLQRLGFEGMHLPHLRTVAQAGGAMPIELVEYFHNAQVRRGGRFHVMYGQTEAAPRMACMPPESLIAKLGSVGPALNGGRFRIVGDGGSEVSEGSIGEVVYEGPNVMMGYATERADLTKPNELSGVLFTGDLGYLDSDGFLYLVGRKKRIAKMAGARVSLDEVEAIASSLARGPVAVTPREDDGINVFHVASSSVSSKELRSMLAAEMRVTPTLIAVRGIEQLPLLSSGKVDYAALTRFDD